MSSYNPTLWKTGDIITSKNLNKVQNQLAKISPVILNTIVVEEDGNSYERLQDQDGWSKIVNAIENDTYKCFLKVSGSITIITGPIYTDPDQNKAYVAVYDSRIYQVRTISRQPRIWLKGYWIYEDLTVKEFDYQWLQPNPS